MQMTTEQTAFFREHGYLALPTFFDAVETEAIQAEVGRLRREGLLNNVATDGDGKTASQTKRNLQLCPMYPHSPLFRALPFVPKVVEAVGSLIGNPMLLHLDQVFLKPAKDGMGTNWHQDNAYFKIRDPLQGTAMWIAVHDATIANGTIHVIPKRFKEEFPHSRDPDSNHHIRCYPAEEEAISVELPAGGVVFFCYGTPHCTRGNTTDRDRAGAAFHFLTVDAAQHSTQVTLAPDRKYNPYLTGPLASGGVNEYGVNMAETWEPEVARARRNE